MSSLDRTKFIQKLTGLCPRFVSYAELEIPKMIASIEDTIEEAPFLSWVSILAKKAGHSCAPLPTPDSMDDWMYFKKMWPEQIEEVLSNIESNLQSFTQKYVAAEPSYIANQSFFIENGWLYSGKQAKEERSIADIFRNGFKLNEKSTNLLNEKWSIIKQLLDSPCSQSGNEYFLDDSQKEAVVRSLLTNISVITGGPGTGKTTTARRLLEAYLLLWTGEDLPRIRMAAPTGKAAARLTESMGLQETPKIENIAEKLDALPKEASTLHRLLGMGFSSKPRYHASNPIDADLILVDEASMIDQYMMGLLLDALGPDTRLILIGDRHQLPSVEAGAVFAQLYPTKQSSLSLYKDASTRKKLVQDTNNPQPWAIAQLQKGHRSSSESGISKLAEYMQNDQAVPDEIAYSDIHLHKNDKEQLADQIKAFVETEKEAFKTIKTVADAFKQIRKTQFLTIISKSKSGSEGINDKIRNAWNSGLYENGMRIIIRQNDYQNELFNGEVGVYLTLDDKSPKFYFEGREAGSPPRSFLPEQLNRFEYAFALTVHKSQGSEYETVHLIAPDTEKRHPLFSKELLYTALTRSKKHFHYWGKKDQLIEASTEPQNRFSQLREKIWGNDNLVY